MTTTAPAAHARGKHTAICLPAGAPAAAYGLLCFLLYPADLLAALRRASVTAGDSDSIACLTGAFAGAHLGLAAWPADWLARIEYRDRLAAICDGLGA